MVEVPLHLQTARNSERHEKIILIKYEIVKNNAGNYVFQIKMHNIEENEIQILTEKLIILLSEFKQCIKSEVKKNENNGWIPDGKGTKNTNQETCRID